MPRTPFFLIPLVALTGCDDRARTFAEQTLAILQHRSAAISAKIAAEKTAYSKAAARDAEDNRLLVETSLANDRHERSRVNADINSAELDTSARYLHNFEVLKFEQDRVDALAKLLAALAKKPSLFHDAKDLAQFAQDSSTDFNKKVCSQIKTNQASSDPKIKAAADAAAKAKSCPTS